MLSMLTEYYRRELKAVGYEPRSRHHGVAIYFSLNYCQGDGMAFEADCDLPALADRLLTGATKAAAKRAIEKGDVSAHVKHEGRYHHCCSMSVEADDYRVEDACTPLEQKAWAELLGAIEDDVEGTSRRLEKEGYKLLENCNPAWFVKDKQGESGEVSYVVWRTFETENFKVVQKLVEDRDYDGYQFGNEHDHEDVKEIVAGRIVVCGVVAEVFDKATGAVLGGASLWGIGDTPDLEYTLILLREETSEAIAEARKNVARLHLRRVA